MAGYLFKPSYLVENEGAYELIAMDAQTLVPNS